MARLSLWTEQCEGYDAGIESSRRGGTIVFFTPAKPGEIADYRSERLYSVTSGFRRAILAALTIQRKLWSSFQKGFVTAEKLVTIASDRRDGTSLSAYRRSKGLLKSLVVFKSQGTGNFLEKKCNRISPDNRRRRPVAPCPCSPNRQDVLTITGSAWSFGSDLMLFVNVSHPSPAFRRQ